MEVSTMRLAPNDKQSQRLLQSLALLAHFVTVLMGGPMSYVVTAYVMLCTHFYWLALAYVCYVIMDRGVSCRGGRSCRWVRRWAWWRYFRDYFPVRLVKTAELDPSNNYLLCAYPHGFLPLGLYTNFATEATNFSSVFPGLSSHLITLGQFLWVPIVREVILRQGMCSSSWDSINFLLDPSRGTGKAVVLVVGGAAEALKSSPGSYHIILTRRKGFVKAAIKNGASLVPVLSFGETDLYELTDNPKGSWVLWCQKYFDRLKNVSLVFMIIRLMFQFSYPIIPRRTPITTVVGNPIPVCRDPEPTEQQVDALHKKFKEELVQLFEQHKHNYVKDPLNTFLHIE